MFARPARPGKAEVRLRSDHSGRHIDYEIPLERPKECTHENDTTDDAAALVIGSSLAPHGASAQLPETIKRTDLMKEDLSIPGREVVQVRVDISARVTAPRHNHPGEEIAYVIEGELEYQLEDEPPVTLKAGEVLFIPHGTHHEVKNAGSVSAAELATYIVEQGKPLVAFGQVSAR
jgi:quercetin dioxygenase-like cupin family protein